MKIENEENVIILYLNGHSRNLLETNLKEYNPESFKQIVREDTETDDEEFNQSLPGNMIIPYFLLIEHYNLDSILL